MYEYSSKFLNNVQKVVKFFLEITNNEIFFTSISGAIVDCNTLLFDINVSLSYLRKLDFKKYYTYPLIINSSLSGFFVLDSSKLGPESVQLCAKYLKTSCDQFIDDGSSEILVLDPLSTTKVSSLAKALHGILNISEDLSNGNATPSPFSINNSNTVESSTSDMEKNIIMALKYINANLEKSLTLENVSQKIYLSPSYLSRIFKNYFNDNFINYINLQKIALAQEKLVFSNLPINKLAHQVGFSQTSYFTKIFKQKVGMTPSKYRKYNSAIKKIYTIPRDLQWRSNKSVYEISKEFFNQNDISFKARDLNGYPYIYSINGLNDVRNEAGWVYTVDCAQPIIPASEINVTESSVIQWIYTEKII